MPTYTAEPVKEEKQKEKQHYMLLTLSGHGVLACVAMRSGTSKKMQDEHGIKFWYERLQELGIGTAVIEDQLKAMEWVRTYHAMLCSLASAWPRSWSQNSFTVPSELH